jgi:hypothetical protein
MKVFSTLSHLPNPKLSRRPGSYIVGYQDFPCPPLLHFHRGIIEEETYNMAKLIKSVQLSHIERQFHDCTNKAPLRNFGISDSEILPKCSEK